MYEERYTPPQNTFRAADAGPLRNKYAPCAECQKRPAEGERFSVCSRCKDMMYCSRDCQKKNWPTHKHICELKQKVQEETQDPNVSHASPDLPPLPVRMNLLTDFIEAHAWMIQKVAYSALLVHGGNHTFDYAHTCLVFRLEYRTDCGGNPSRAFRVLDGSFKPVAEVWATKAGSKRAWDAGRAMREAGEEELRATYPGPDRFIGTLMVFWDIGDYAHWYPLEQYRLEPEWELKAAQGEHRTWLQHLRNVADKGFVYRQTDEEDGLWYMGRLKKVGHRWQWEQFTPQKLVSMGYPRDYRVFL